MQGRFIFSTPEGFSVPLSYNHQLQSGIYRKLSQAGISDEIHTKFSGHRNFIFGKLSGDNVIRDKQMFFNSRLSFEVRSQSFDIIDALQRSFELYPYIKLFDTCLPLKDAIITNKHINSSSAQFKAVSPVVAKKRLPDGSTLYHAPHSEEFRDSLTRNFLKKYWEITNKQYDGNIDILPVGEHRKIITSYKGIIINAYLGDYIISADSTALELIYNSGLGAKNSQGFGMLEIKQEKAV